jgi:hypothetical protein
MTSATSGKVRGAFRQGRDAADFRLRRTKERRERASDRRGGKRGGNEQNETMTGGGATRLNEGRNERNEGRNERNEGRNERNEINE